MILRYLQKSVLSHVDTMEPWPPSYILISTCSASLLDELCRQKAGLPPRRLRRSNYFRLPPCDNVNLQGPSGL